MSVRPSSITNFFLLNILLNKRMIIRQLKDRGKTAAAAKSLIGYLLGPEKELGFVSEFPRDVGKSLIVKEASAREGKACYYHFVTSVRFDENPTPTV